MIDLLLPVFLFAEFADLGEFSKLYGIANDYVYSCRYTAVGRSFFTPPQSSGSHRLANILWRFLKRLWFGITAISVAKNALFLHCSIMFVFPSRENLIDWSSSVLWFRFFFAVILLFYLRVFLIWWRVYFQSLFFKVPPGRPSVLHASRGQRASVGWGPRSMVRFSSKRSTVSLENDAEYRWLA